MVNVEPSYSQPDRAVVPGSAILRFLRRTVPKKWDRFRDRITENFRIISKGQPSSPERSDDAAEGSASKLRIEQDDRGTASPALQGARTCLFGLLN